MEAVRHFHWADWLVLVVFLVITSLTGVFIGLRDRKKITSASFFTGGGNMHWAVVAFSLQASFVSSIFILGMPVEEYRNGTTHYYLVIAFFTGITFSGYVVMPMFYKLELISAYEYLEIRFNRTVRTACAICFFLQIFLYMSVVLYSPALALAQVSGLSVSISIVVCGLVCIFYTVVGGMKATIWNDFIQITIISLTLVMLMILGLIKLGGFQKIWDTNVKGGRIEFDNFRTDPRLRTTFWTQTIGGFFINLSMFASNQTSIQKFSGVKTLSGAKKSALVCAISISLAFTVVCFIGLEAYALYVDCDPMTSNKIVKHDQIVPLFVMDVMGHLHGLPGLFIAAVFSAALSSLSGNLNSMTAVTLTDFINPAYAKITGTQINEKIRTILSRCLTLGFGFLVIGMGFMAQHFGDVVVQMAFSIFGFVGGPLTCVIICGMTFPFLNSIGTLCGLIASIIISSWIAIGALLTKVPNITLPTGSNCTMLLNQTIITSLAPPTAPMVDDSPVMNIYKLSYMYYGVVALIVHLLVAIPISLITGRDKKVERKLIIDWFGMICCCLPSSLRWLFQCGTELTASEEDEMKTEAIEQSINSYLEDFVGKRDMSIRVPRPASANILDDNNKDDNDSNKNDNNNNGNNNNNNNEDYNISKDDSPSDDNGDMEMISMPSTPGNDDSTDIYRRSPAQAARDGVTEF